MNAALQREAATKVSAVRARAEAVLAELLEVWIDTLAAREWLARHFDTARAAREATPGELPESFSAAG